MNVSHIPLMALYVSLSPLLLVSWTNTLVSQPGYWTRSGSGSLRSFSLVRIPLAGPFGTVPELLFEKKGLIPALQQLLVSCSKA